MVLASGSVSKQNWQSWESRRPGEGRRAGARMRRCLKLRQGASPLRPPAPFPSTSMVWGEGNLSRVRKPRQSSAPLTDCLHPGRERNQEEGKGAYGQAGAYVCLPLVGPEEGPNIGEGKLCLTTTGLLMEAAEEVSR